MPTRAPGTVLVLHLLVCGGCDSEPTPSGTASGSKLAPAVVSPRAEDPGLLEPLAVPVERPPDGDREAAHPHLIEALKLVRLERPKEAVEQLEAALKLDPAFFEAHLLMGTVYLTPVFAFGGSQALYHYRLARTLQPDHLGAQIGEARARAHLQDDELARLQLDHIESRIRRDGIQLGGMSWTEIHRSYGAIEYRAGRHEEALRRFDLALAHAPADAASLVWRAKALEDLGRPREADASLEQAIQQQPDHAQAHYIRARILRSLGDLEGAERELRIHRLVQPFEDDASERFAKNAELRIELREELVAAYPEFRRARHLLLREYLAARRVEQALKLARKLVEEDASDAEALFLLARAQAQAGLEEDARESARALSELNEVPREVTEDLLRLIEEERGG